MTPADVDARLDELHRIGALRAPLRNLSGHTSVLPALVDARGVATVSCSGWAVEDAVRLALVAFAEASGGVLEVGLIEAHSAAEVRDGGDAEFGDVSDGDDEEDEEVSFTADAGGRPVSFTVERGWLDPRPVAAAMDVAAAELGRPERFLYVGTDGGELAIYLWCDPSVASRVAALVGEP